MKHLDLDSSLESCLRFVRLHGWCDQTHQNIDGVIAALAAGPVPSDLAQRLERRLPSLTSIEERLFGLVVLHRLGAAISHIAEITLQVLKNQISENDLAFLSRYFFDGGYPLPGNVIAEITKGNFFTYKRAIYQAMSITELASDYSGQHVLLFLVQLLCRNSLNEQNRAILYVLLSRIDVERPPGLAAIVTSAMTVLAGLVREVIERGDSVLADRLDPAERALDQALAELSAQANPLPSVAEIPPKRQRGTVGEEQRLDEPAGGTLSIVTSTRASGRRGRADLAASPSESLQPARKLQPSTPRATVPRSSSPPTDGIEPNDEWLQTSALNPDARGSTTSLQGSSSGTSQTRSSLDDYETGGSQPALAAKKRVRQRFLIRFDRESDEVRQLFATEPSTVQPVQEAPSAANPPRREEAPPRWRVGRKSFAWLLVAVMALILAASAWFFWPSTRGQIPSPSPQSAPSVPALQPQSPAHSTRWSPQPGDSLWTWYKTIHTQPDHGAAHSLAGLSWPDFVDQVRRMNRSVEHPDLIYPGKELSLDH